ncbi:Fur family transcriptional regulator, ferric uptake regulator [Marivirga sericea]|jgi:Fur family ferric uptake transcriptional regulator|uniref:Fur family transcriptional regulator, ferric uptake regulator n=1 Tax=Marivirga sericea TaxID=1028 RepID=A0A1X7IH40_9BACT|nr:transcriptional repressor [Marivirga sericea]SMG13971.1 Fur family transcriptional regulator, ferric uptake regulator [Marivirga sericea]
MSVIKELEENLLQHKIKPTAMRLLVLEYLLDHEIAVSLTDLYRDFVKSDRTTIYRTLKAFEDNGLVHSIDDGTGVPKYALCSDACDVGKHDDAHIHFHCDKCGKTYCLPKFSIPHFELPESFSKNEVNLVVKGICPDCK